MAEYTYHGILSMRGSRISVFSFKSCDGDKFVVCMKACICINGETIKNNRFPRDVLSEHSGKFIVTKLHKTSQCYDYAFEIRDKDSTCDCADHHQSYIPEPGKTLFGILIDYSSVKDTYTVACGPFGFTVHSSWVTSLGISPECVATPLTFISFKAYSRVYRVSGVHYFNVNTPPRLESLSDSIKSTIFSFEPIDKSLLMANIVFSAASLPSSISASSVSSVSSSNSVNMLTLSNGGILDPAPAASSISSTTRMKLDRNLFLSSLNLQDISISLSREALCITQTIEEAKTNPCSVTSLSKVKKAHTFDNGAPPDHTRLRMKLLELNIDDMKPTISSSDSLIPIVTVRK
nr:uncharacterized protein LOC128704182 [Cherax quadricarinatus]